MHRKLLAMLFAAFLVACTQSHLEAQDQRAFTIKEDVIYGHKAGMALTFDVVTPENSNGKAVLFMMSGGWVSMKFPAELMVRKEQNPPNQFEKIVNAGYTLFIVRHGSSPYFKIPDAVADVKRAVRFIRLHASDYGIDPERIGVCGGSAGGHLSLMLGTTADDGIADSKDPVEHVSCRVQAVVAYFPPTLIEEFFPLTERFPALDFDHSLAGSVSPLLHVSEDDAPALLVHGDKDDLVPLSNSERIAEAFKKTNVPTELVVITNAGHGYIGEDAVRADQSLINWFNKYLLDQPQGN